MAFKNVYGNVDFRMPVEAAYRKQQSFADAIGRGIQMAQFREKMDLQKRQLEQRENQFDLNSAAESAYMKVAMGQPLTPQEQAAADVYQSMKMRPRVYTNELGYTVQEPAPNIMQQLTGMLPAGGTASPPAGGGAVTPVPMDLGDVERAIGAQGQGSNPAITKPYDEISPTEFVSDDMPPMPRVNEPERPSDYVMGSPLMQKKKGESFIDEMRDVRKEQRGARQELDTYFKKKQIDSVFKGQELTDDAVQKQQGFEAKLLEYVNEVGSLIDTGTYIRELPENATINDVLKNVGAAVQSTEVGKGLGGAIGTRPATAMARMESTHPLLFGELRDLLGMTGRELDTAAEQRYYKGIIPKGNTEISVVLDTLNELSQKFGTGDAAQRLGELKKGLDVRDKVRQMTPEEKLKRIEELRAKAR